MRKFSLLGLILALLCAGILPAGVAAAEAAPKSTQEKFDVLRTAGIFTGYQDGSAGLEREMTREQFAAVLTRLWKLEFEAGTKYTDVATNRWSAPYIMAVNKAGLMNGRSATRFGPAEPVTIQELAVILTRAYKLALPTNAKVEGQVAPWAANAVAAALAKGLIPKQPDYRIKAVRAILVEAAYSIYMDLGATPVSASVVNNKRIEVTFSDGNKQAYDLKEELKPNTETGVRVTYQNREFIVKVVWVFTPLKIQSVSPVSNIRLSVTLQEKVNQIDGSQFSLKDDRNKIIGIRSAELRADGKTVVLVTEPQTEFRAHTLSVDGSSKTFVAVAIDRTKPKVVKAYINPNATITVEFSEWLNPYSAADINRYKINHGVAVRKAELSRDGKVVTLITTVQKQGTIYTMDIEGIVDLSDNVMEPKKGIQFAGVVDTTKPVVESVKAFGSGVLEVRFSEKVTADSAQNTSNYSTNPGLSITRAELQADGRTVYVSTSKQNVGTVYTLTVQQVADPSGNVMDRRTGIQFGGAVDQKKPGVKSARANGDGTITIVMTEKVRKDSAENLGNYAVNQGLSMKQADLKDDGITIIVSTSEQREGVVYTLSVFQIMDLAGNPMDGKKEIQFGGVHDSTKPQITGISVSAGKVVLTFSERLEKASAEQELNYTFDGGLNYPSSASYNDDKKTVTLYTAGQTAGKIYTLHIQNVKDRAGNAVADGTVRTFSGVGTAAADIRLDSIYTAANNIVDLVFSRKLSSEELSSVKVELTKDNGNSWSIGGVTAKAVPHDNEQIARVQFRTSSDVNPNLFQPGHVYTLKVSGIRGLDTAGEANVKQFAGISTPNNAPYVNKVTALNTTAVQVFFSEAVKNIRKDAFVIRSADDKDIPVSSEQVNDANRIVKDVILNLGAKLEAGKVYHMTFKGSVTDAAGFMTLKTSENNQPFTVTFGGVGHDNAAPRIKSAAAVDRYTFDIEFTEPVLNSEEGAYVLINETDNKTIPLGIGAQVSYRDSADLTKVRVYLYAGAVEQLRSGKIYKVVYQVSSNKITDKQYKAFDPAQGAAEARFAGVDFENAAPKVESVLAYTDRIEIAFSEEIIGYTNQTDLFEIRIDGKILKPSSGKKSGRRTIVLQVSGLSPGKVGTIKPTAAGISAIKDLTRQSITGDTVTFGVR